MILEFSLVLFLTLIITRLSAYLLHDFDAYKNRKWKGKEYDKSKTFTGILRRKLSVDIHHMYLGLAILIILIPIIIFNGLTKLVIFALAIGLSLFLDQIISLSWDIEYFGGWSLGFSLLLHILAVVAFAIILTL